MKKVLQPRGLTSQISMSKVENVVGKAIILLIFRLKRCITVYFDAGHPGRLRPGMSPSLRQQLPSTCFKGNPIYTTLTNFSMK